MEMVGYSAKYRKSEGFKIITPKEERGSPEKWCNQCRKYQTTSEFSVDSSQNDNLRSICKKCDNINRTNRKRKKRQSLT